MSAITGGDLHGVRAVLARSIPVVRSDNPPSKLTLVELSAEQKSWLAQQKAAEAARHAEFAARVKAAEAAAKQEDHTIRLPNITSLTTDIAQKVKGFVEVMIQNHEDVGRNVSGGYNQQQVTSLGSYLSLITNYINEKGVQEATPQPDTTTPTTSTADEDVSTTPVPSTSTSDTPTQTEPIAGADPNWTDPAGQPGQNHIYLPNVASLSSETAAAVYKQVSSMVDSRDISDSVIHARNGDAGTYSIGTYMSWLAQRAATNIVL